jgi:hypothetical protein
MNNFSDLPWSCRDDFSSPKRRTLNESAEMVRRGRSVIAVIATFKKGTSLHLKLRITKPSKSLDDGPDERRIVRIAARACLVFYQLFP